LNNVLGRCRTLAARIGGSETAPVLLLIGVGLAHRLLLFTYYFDDVALMVRDNPDWLTWQYLTIPALREHLADSLLYLQQTPPLPQLFLGIALKVLSWPAHVSYFLILANGLISIVAATLLYRLGVRLTGMKLLSLGIALLFLLNADLVVIEYNSLGQTIYENSCMVWVLLFVTGGVQLTAGQPVRGTVLMAVATALLIMTRSAYAYFFIAPLILLLLARPARWKKCLAIAVAVWLSTHGAWSLKNYLVYDRASLSTSTWQGANLAKGLVSTGFEQPFRAHILRNEFGAPDWFVNHVRSVPTIPIWGEGAWAVLPGPVRQKSGDIDARLDGTNRWENSVALAEYVKYFEPAYTSFAVENPSIIATKLYRSYELFWVPIRNYGGLYLSLFQVDWVIRRSLSIGGILRHWVSGQLPEAQWIVRGKYGHSVARPATLFTIDCFSPLVAILALIAVHVFLPYQCIKESWRSIRGRAVSGKLLMYLNPGLVIAYSTFVFVLVEHGENMRFRLSVEPVIWLCMLLMLAAAHATAKRALHRGKRAARPLAAR